MQYKPEKLVVTKRTEIFPILDIRDIEITIYL